MKHRTRISALAGAAALIVCFLPFASACSGENDATAAGSCVPGSVQQCLCSNGTTGTQTCNASGAADACVCASGPNGGNAIPCDVQTVLQNKCYACHGTSTQFGAPSFLTVDSFRKPSVKNSSMSVGALAAVRITDPTQQMPPAAYPQLTAQETQILKNWSAAGNPAGQACSAPPTSNPTGMPTGTPTSTPTTNPTGNPTTNPTGNPTTEPTGNPAEDVQCYKITARQNASGAKYQVPNTPDYYNCFSWAVPWGSKKVHIVSTKPLIDNTNVIHHWILYNNAGAVQDGTSARCVGAHPDAAFIAGWAPGGQAETMPPDVGLIVTGAGFTLETHYNAKTAGQQDQSGVELCVTEKLRPKEAAVHWLGTQNLSKINATGTCSPRLAGPVNIIASSPHMHVQGRHMKTVINRSGGKQDILIDKPFDFNTQISYETPAVINPGDTLTTTCTYAQPTPFGQGTNQEMCYNFVTAYPAGQLTNGGSFLRINDCTQ